MRFYATTKDPGEGTVFVYEDIWDADQMYGCNCDDAYYGMDCSQKFCPVGDDPMTGSGTSTAGNPTQFNDIQKVTCR
jgi:hypothetical protein